MTRRTFHLSPVEVWSAASAGFAEGRSYEAASLASEGFIHCTDGVEALGETFDRYYAADPRAFVALTVDLESLGVPWRYDVPGSPYPHIYGAIPPAAVVAVQSVRRGPGGTFDGLGEATD